MNLNEYQQFVIENSIYPEQHKFTYTALGLTGEAGEYAEKIKKWLRGDSNLDIFEASKELGDCLFYVTAAANDLGISLEEVALRNMEKINSRKQRGVIKGNGDNR